MNDALTTDQLKEWAKHLYTREDKSLEAIAHETGLDNNQLRDWRNNGSWEGIKRTIPTTKEYQIEQLYKLLEKSTGKLNEADEVNPKEVDLIVKYTAAIKNLDTEIGLPQIVEVAKLFTTWLKSRDLDKAKDITAQFDKFIKERVK